MDIKNEIITLCRKEEMAAELRRNAARLARFYHQQRVALLAVLDNKVARRGAAGGTNHASDSVRRNISQTRSTGKRENWGGAR